MDLFFLCLLPTSGGLFEHETSCGLCGIALNYLLFQINAYRRELFRKPCLQLGHASSYAASANSGSSLASYIPCRLTLPQTLPHTLPTLPHTLRLSTRVLSTLLKGWGRRRTTFALYLASSPFLGLVLRLPFHTPVVSIVAVTIVTTATPATPTAIVTTSPIFAAISRGAHLTRFLLPV